MRKIEFEKYIVLDPDMPDEDITYESFFDDKGSAEQELQEMRQDNIEEYGKFVKTHDIDNLDDWWGKPLYDNIIARKEYLTNCKVSKVKIIYEIEE